MQKDKILPAMVIPQPLLEYHQLSFYPFQLYLEFHNLKISMDHLVIQSKFAYLQQLPISFPDETVTWLGDVAVDVPGQEESVQYSHCSIIPLLSTCVAHQGVESPSITVHLSWILFLYMKGKTQFPQDPLEGVVEGDGVGAGDGVVTGEGVVAEVDIGGQVFSPGIS